LNYPRRARPAYALAFRRSALPGQMCTHSVAICPGDATDASNSAGVGVADFEDLLQRAIAR